MRRFDKCLIHFNFLEQISSEKKMLIFMTTQDMVDYHHELFNLVIYSITIKHVRSEAVILGPPILIGGSMVT